MDVDEQPRGSTVSPRQRALALVPIALISAGWTLCFNGVSASTGATAPSSTAAPLESPTSAALPMPAVAIEAGASVSGAGASTRDMSRTQTVALVERSSTNGISAAALAAYQRAESVINSADESCNLTWQLIAAIGRVESNHGRFGGNVLDDDGVAQPGIFGIALDGSNNTSVIRDTDAGQFDNDSIYDRAVGPMQFIPSTWSVVGVDADGDGQRDPQDIDDAALATSVYLCSGSQASGGDLATAAGQRAAVYRYNHSRAYVDLVLSITDAYLDGDFTSIPNNTSAAGLLVPMSTSSTRPARADQLSASAEGAVAQPVASVPGTDDGDTRPHDPQDGPGSGDSDGPPDQEQDGDSAHPVKLPQLPETHVEPLDQVLTLAQAVVQCTLTGLLDNPLIPTDRFDRCVADQTDRRP